MKRVLILLLAAVIFSTIAYAQNTDDDNTSRDMAILRKKLGQMKREMDLLVREVVSTVPATGDTSVNTFGGDVYVDILQNDKSVIVKADLPGMEKDKINVVLDNNRFLKISGSREILKSEKSPGVVRQERFFGNFSKVIELPCEVTPAGINATYKDGVLEITIPKKAKSPKEEPVKINVK
ncbi:MAG: Hsp20/alpha crystallin family protein [Candidatus Omnitrophota bacterium]|nr:Hsp20/alpha crystallin family protein [Candidatus Omnitrophota bacterium]